MGCNTSVHVKVEMSKSEKAMKAALLIQRWYRRYTARLEARRRATWAIFQSIEYSGEQDQLKLSNFFNAMLEQFSMTGDKQESVMKAFSSVQQRPLLSAADTMAQYQSEESKLRSFANPNKYTVEKSYDGPHLSFPITREQIRNMFSAFRENKTLHVRYLLELLHQARKALMGLTNLNRVSTSLSGQVTVCGDLHGKLDDLYTIFQKNGLPGVDNPYIFNGDFVDRGHHSVEVMILLLVCLLHSPQHIWLNRGNHEDQAMNMRYGFTKEILQKYKQHSYKVVRMFQEVYSWLPLGTIVDDKIFIVHGGVSDCIDLNFVDGINRHKYTSVLRPPAMVQVEEGRDEELDLCDIEEWKQILDLLWSDPRDPQGCYPNTFRGGGCYFGPDVTSRFLNNHSLSMLIRSHECKEEGYEYTHGGKVLTIFSTSNYYDEGSNKGAYVKVTGSKEIMEPNKTPTCHVVQFVAPSRGGRRLTFTERISHLEASALTHVREKIIANRTQLEQEFAKYDPDNTGIVQASEWCQVMESVMEIDVPWRLLRSRLVEPPEDDFVMSKVDYTSMFQTKRVSMGHLLASGPSVAESLYRHKDILETIFRTFDRDNSGNISMTEFTEACQILIQHANLNLHQSQISDIARSLDFNKDGHIDFNEFLEAFRIVDSEDKRRTANLMFGLPNEDCS